MASDMSDEVVETSPSDGETGSRLQELLFDYMNKYAKHSLTHDEAEAACAYLTSLLAQSVHGFRPEFSGAWMAALINDAKYVLRMLPDMRLEYVQKGVYFNGAKDGYKKRAGAPATSDGEKANERMPDIVTATHTLQVVHARDGRATMLVCGAVSTPRKLDGYGLEGSWVGAGSLALTDWANKNTGDTKKSKRPEGKEKLEEATRKLFRSTINPSGKTRMREYVAPRPIVSVSAPVDRDDVADTTNFNPVVAVENMAIVYWYASQLVDGWYERADKKCTLPYQYWFNVLLQSINQPFLGAAETRKFAFTYENLAATAADPAARAAQRGRLFKALARKLPLLGAEMPVDVKSIAESSVFVRATETSPWWELASLPAHFSFSVKQQIYVRAYAYRLIANGITSVKAFDAQVNALPEHIRPLFAETRRHLPSMLSSSDRGKYVFPKECYMPNLDARMFVHSYAQRRDKATGTVRGDTYMLPSNGSGNLSLYASRVIRRGERVVAAARVELHPTQMRDTKTNANALYLSMDPKEVNIVHRAPVRSGVEYDEWSSMPRMEVGDDEELVVAEPARAPVDGDAAEKSGSAKSQAEQAHASDENGDARAGGSRDPRNKKRAHDAAQHDASDAKSVDTDASEPASGDEHANGAASSYGDYEEGDYDVPS